MNPIGFRNSNGTLIHPVKEFDHLVKEEFRKLELIEGEE